MSRELLKRVDEMMSSGGGQFTPGDVIRLHDHIREYLAQPEPEPVGIVNVFTYEMQKCFNTEWLSYPLDWEFGTHKLYPSPPGPPARPVGVVLDNDGDGFEIEWDFSAIRVLKEGTKIYTTPPDQSARIADELEEAVIAVNALTTDRNEISQTLGKALDYPFVNHDYTEVATNAELAALQAKRKPLSSELLAELAQQANKASNPYYEFARAIEAAHGIKGE